jgi:hypothetical protein
MTCGKNPDMVNEAAAMPTIVHTIWRSFYSSLGLGVLGLTSLEYFFALNQPDYQQNDGDDHQDMNETPHREAAHQCQHPQHQENYPYDPKHVCPLSSDSILPSISIYLWKPLKRHCIKIVYEILPVFCGCILFGVTE